MIRIWPLPVVDPWFEDWWEHEKWYKQWWRYLEPPKHATIEEQMIEIRPDNHMYRMVEIAALINNIYGESVKPPKLT